MELTGFALPERVERDPETYTESFGEFLIQPLERGFGMTLGNSLRRALLSSIKGTAVWGVVIQGVLHEYSTIPGVVEDVTEVIMNLKRLVLSLEPEVPETTMKLKASKPGTITAKAFEVPTGLTIHNPELPLFTLEEKKPVEIEVFVRQGRGYVPADQLGATQEIGFIPIDAIYSPIRRVNFRVENTRVGQRTDYDRLHLQVTTDGTVRPEEAVNYAARLLIRHFEYFLSFQEPLEEAEAAWTARQEQLKELLARPVDELELSVRSNNCLKSQNIETLGDLVQRTEAEMLEFRNFGKKSLNEIAEILERYDLRFGMKVEVNEKGEYIVHGNGGGEGGTEEEAAESDLEEGAAKAQAEEDEKKEKVEAKGNKKKSAKEETASKSKS